MRGIRRQGTGRQQCTAGEGRGDGIYGELKRAEVAEDSAKHGLNETDNGLA